MSPSNLMYFTVFKPISKNKRILVSSFDNASTIHDQDNSSSNLNIANIVGPLRYVAIIQIEIVR